MTAQRFVRLIAVIALAAAGALRAASSATPVSPAAFFSYDDFGRVTLSPSGKYIAALVPKDGLVHLAVLDVATRKSSIVASVDGGDVTWFAWVNDERLIAQGAVVKDAVDRRRNRGMIAVNADGTEFVQLGRFSVLTTLRDGSNDVLTLSYQFNRRFPEVSRLDTKIDRGQILTLGKPGDVVRWVADAQGVVRAAVTDEKSLASRVFWRAAADSPWVQLGEFKLGEPRLYPLAFDGDGSLIVASNVGRDTYAIYRYDTTKKALGEVLAESGQNDLTGSLQWDRSKNRIVGLAYNAALPGAVWFDEDWALLQQTIDKALPDHRNVLSGDARRALIYSYSDVDPGTYYLYDGEKRRLEFLLARRKGTRADAMPARKPVRYAARDGLEIPGYLTLPKGREAKGLPLIVDVHGGPFVRGAYWGWSPEPAYLASLGYAVLEPEFRGSAGWGRALQVAGWKQWGRGMQDDLDDGVDWLVKEGIADGKRVCIMGGSYGGYAVMIGLARNPERWRCGVNYVGVTDINLYFDVTWSDYAYSDWIEYAAKEMVGDQAKDAAMLKAASPLENASRITAPVLMAYGLQDSRVPIIHGEKMRDALQAAHKSVEWVVYQEEGHGFLLEKNRYDFYGRVATFLREHNPPD